jgi:hypothetical protein
MGAIRVRDLLIPLPLILLSIACFVAGIVLGGVVFALIAVGMVVLLVQPSTVTGSARYVEQSPQDVMLRWQYPGNSGGGAGGGM